MNLQKLNSFHWPVGLVNRKTHYFDQLKFFINVCSFYTGFHFYSRWCPFIHVHFAVFVAVDQSYMEIHYCAICGGRSELHRDSAAHPLALPV